MGKFYANKAAEQSRKDGVQRKKIAIGDMVRSMSEKKAPRWLGKCSDCIVQELTDQTAKVAWPDGWSSLLVRANIRQMT